MKIIELEGTAPRLYALVAHLTMNEEVLKYNLNYPYRTSPQHRWFLAMRNKVAIGFVPIKVKTGKATINNYWVAGDNSEVFSALLKQATQTLLPECEIEAVAQAKHVSYFEKHGFVPEETNWKRFVKMKVYGHEKKCL